MYTSKIYTSSPVWLQTFFVSTKGLVSLLLKRSFGFERLKKELSTHDYNKKLLNVYQESKLSCSLENAVSNTIFYGEIDSSSIANFKIIDKGIIKENWSKMLSKKFSFFVISGSTSGTSGMPLIIKQNLNSIIREEAFVQRYLEWAGYRRGDLIAWIRGDMIVPIDSLNKTFWRRSLFERKILFSSFHLSNDNIPLYINKMVSENVAIIQAYPSSIIEIASYLEMNDIYYPSNLKSIVTSSESLSLEQKTLIEKRFKCKVYDWYGMFERVAAIGSCEYGNYHLITDYSFVEFEPVDELRFEIVGTNFNNSLFPLIRYKTGDFLKKSNTDVCKCKRVFPVVDKVEGREGDYLYTSAKHKVYIVNHIPKGVEGLYGVQFVQTEYDKIVLNVVADSKFTLTEEVKLKRNVKQKLGDVSVEVVRLFSLPRTSNGKFKQVICTL